ncbi:MAG: 4Fe-4S binding protein, partial [Pseudomonadota bacterium]
MRNARRIVQVLFLLFFVQLFLAASYPLEPLVPVDLFLRTNPLVALSTMISSRSIITPCLWSIALILLTIPMGRVFCGWACPLGTLLDGASTLFRNKAEKNHHRLRSLKYYLLVVILIASIFTLQLTWTLDPITLITRTLTLSLFPAATMASTSIFNRLFRLDFLQDTLGQLQMKLNSTLLPDEPALFHWSGLVLLIFLIIVGLELVSRRFWCRNLCPLGALYGLLAKYQVFKRRVSDQCNDCRLCASDCKMGAIEKGDFRKTSSAECILCYNCTVTCRRGATSLGFNRPEAQAFNLSRRSMLASSAASLSSVM